MIFTFEALEAAEGDALLLHWGKPADPRLAVIDGGPRGTYARTLRPRLQQIRQSRVGRSETLPVRLAMVSHIDADHIAGMIDMFGEMVEAKEGSAPAPFEVDTLWHNSFDDLLGNDADELVDLLGPASRATIAASTAGRPLPGGLRHDSALVAASVNQGRQLRDQASGLGVPFNAEFDGKLVAAEPTTKVKVDVGGGLKFTVLGPFRNRVEDLQEKWAADLRKRASRSRAEAQAIAAATQDKSVTNLASISVLAEADGKSILLTGDARDDDLLDGLKAAKLLRDGKCHVDVLKVPHHGSDKNVSTEFFTAVTADHYVFSANGKHDNPDVATFQMLTDARGRDKYTIHLTNMPKSPHGGKKFFERDQADNSRRYELIVRATRAKSLVLDLGGDALED